MRATRHYVNRDSQAFKDGRSRLPNPPKEFFWIHATRLINTSLGTSYKVEEIMAMPGDLFEMIMAWITV